jgi:S1-C subfamily serine protease
MRATNGSYASSGIDASKAEAPDTDALVGVTINLRGSTIVIRDAANGAEVARHQLSGGETTRQLPLRLDREYEFEALLGQFATQRRAKESPGEVDLTFDPEEIRNICRMATCLIKLPEGGFGSGFLFGDRQTIVTAAHVLTTRNVGEVEIIFDPAENEERYAGARLIYFDAEQDVALVHLPEPVSDRRPFLHRMDQNPETTVVQVSRAEDPTKPAILTFVRREVIVVGNPGRGNDYDPLFTREAKIVGGRPDEFEINIELKPGYSGGPVCLADSMQECPPFVPTAIRSTVAFRKRQERWPQGRPTQPQRTQW